MRPYRANRQVDPGWPCDLHDCDSGRRDRNHSDMKRVAHEESDVIYEHRSKESPLVGITTYRLVEGAADCVKMGAPLVG